MPEYSPAYARIEAAAIAVGRPLIAAEVARVIETDDATAAEFRAINAEIEAGAEITDAQIADRVRMPLPFIRSLLLAIRDDEARPSKLN